MTAKTMPTNTEVYFDQNDIIVSKTDLKGRLTYANRVFLEIAGYRRDEVIGAPHSIIRHPDMPRAIFKVLWDSILAGKEVFAFVKNMTKRGDHYWVFAHVTPSRDGKGNVVGFHSNRRVPNRKQLETVIMPLYADLLRAERAHANAKQGLEAASQSLADVLTKRGVAYDEFIFAS